MISFIVPTIGRESLSATLASIETWPGDEILVIGVASPHTDERARYITCERGHDWGCRERTIGISYAKGQYLAFLDDDDLYLPGARQSMQRAIQMAQGRPTLCRMVYPNGCVLWRDPVLRCGNVSTQMMLIPNEPAYLGQWSTRREGDYDFLTSMAWPPASIQWWPEIIARLGHNDGA